MILPVWLENAQPRNLFGFFGVESFKIVGRHQNPPKGTIIGRVI